MLDCIVAPGAVPISEGLAVFAYGFSGVFVALGLLAGGIKVVSMVAARLESGAGGEKKK